MMAKSQVLTNFGQIVEKIVFDEDELEKLKIAIKNFTQGKTSAKELKNLLLQCRGRMVEDMTDYVLFIAKKIATEKAKELTPSTSLSPSQIESQLREEIEEKNELLETVAIRVNNLVSQLINKETFEDQNPISKEEVKEEVERCLNQIGAKEWIDMCFYDDYQFFTKFYPKLEALYKERFGESEEIMAIKMKKLGFPEDIETIVNKYISIRNKFQHSMEDMTPSNLKLTREAFAKVFVYLTLSNIKSKFLLKNREMFYSNLTEFFSKRLTGNPPFRKTILDRFKTVFDA